MPNILHVLLCEIQLKSNCNKNSKLSLGTKSRGHSAEALIFGQCSCGEGNRCIPTHNDSSTVQNKQAKHSNKPLLFVNRVLQVACCDTSLKVLNLQLVYMCVHVKKRDYNHMVYKGDVILDYDQLCDWNVLMQLQEHAVQIVMMIWYIWIMQ